MNAPPPSTRRDLRFRLRPDIASVELSDPEHGDPFLAPVVSISASGFAFQIEGEPDRYRFGICFAGAVLQVGECRMRGEAVVRNTRRLEQGRIEVGCLFYPTAADEDRWMTLVAGIEIGAPRVEDPS